MKKAITLVSIIVLNITGSLANAYWTPPARVSQSGTFYQPAMIFDSEAAHIIAYMDNPNSYVTYQNSVDFGNSWSIPFRISSPAISSSVEDPRFLRLNSNLMISWINIDNQGIYRQNLGFRRSSDLGTNWIADHEILANDIEIVVNQAIGTSRDFIYTVYSTYSSDTLLFYFTKSTDIGTSWSAPTFMFWGGDMSFIRTVAFGDTIHVLWAGEIIRPGPYNVWYSRSIDGGQTWSPCLNIRNYEGSAGEWPGLTQNESGVLLAYWMDYRYSNYGLTGDIFVRKSTDFRESLAAEIQVADHHRAMSSNAIFQADSIIMAYDDWRYGDWLEVSMIRSTDSGETWFGDERISFDPLDSYDPSIAVTDSHIFLTYAVQDRSGPNDDEGVYFTRYDVFGPDGINEDIGEYKEELSIWAFPNPFNSNIAINLKGTSEGGEMSIEIYDLKGNLKKMIEL